MGVWPFVLISIIMLLSSGFESVKGYIEHRTPETFEPITDAFFSELATLGFIGAIAFVLTYNFDSSCEGACSVMQQLSLRALGEPMELQENFETLHFLLFAVSVVFIFVVLLLLSMTLAASDKLEGVERDICEKQASKTRATALARSGKTASGRRKSVASAGEIGAADGQLTDVVHLPMVRMGELVSDSGPGSSLEDLMRQAGSVGEYVRLRHRFVDDEDDFSDETIPADFDFGLYLKLSLANKYAHIIEIAPVDWGVLWVVTGVVFALYSMLESRPALEVALFFSFEGAILLLSVTIQQKLAGIRAALVPPAPADRQDDKERAPTELGDDAAKRPKVETESLVAPLLGTGGEAAPAAMKERQRQAREARAAGAAEAGGLELARGQTQTKTEDDKKAAKQAEAQLLAQLEALPHGESHHTVSGWLSKLNSTGDGDKAGDWRERLCLCIDGVWSYISEKKAGQVVKVCDLINCAGIVQTAYPQGGRPHAFVLSFYDGSSITFAAPTAEDASRWSAEVHRVLRENDKCVRSLSARTGVRLADPPYVGRARPTFYDAQSWGGWLLGRLCGFNVSKHQTLFWFGANGKAVLMHSIKLVLFTSCLNIAVFLVQLRPTLMALSLPGPDDAPTLATWALRIGLCGLACLLPYLTLKEMPRCMEYLNLTTCIEMMKNDELIREVVQEQKGAKHRKAMQVCPAHSATDKRLPSLVVEKSCLAAGVCVLGFVFAAAYNGGGLWLCGTMVV